MRWDEAPLPVREVVAERLGAVVAAADITTGSAGDVAAILRVASGRRVFVKAVRGVSRRMRWLRNEITGGVLAAPIAPRVLFHADLPAVDPAEHWLVVGHEHVPGRPASLAPNSPDLSAVAAVIERIATIRAPGLRPMRERWAPTDWWARCAAIAPDTVARFDIAEMSRLTALVPDLVAGDRLLHTDLHGDQIIVGPAGVRVIDWGFPGAGAPWVDSALILLRLIEAGHPAAAAETWAGSLPTMTGVDNLTLTAFAVYVAGLWTHIAVTGGPGSPRRAALARDYAAWRLSRTALAINS